MGKAARRRFYLGSCVFRQGNGEGESGGTPLLLLVILEEARTEELDGLAEETAVDANIGTGDERTGLGTGQKNGGTNEFLRLSKAAHWGVAEDGLGSGGGSAIGLEEEFAVLFRWEETWGDGINPDLVGCPFAGQELSEIENGGLGS